MDYYIGLDLSAKSTAICVLDEKGVVVIEKEVKTDKESLGFELSSYKGAHCVVESSGLSEWFCDVIESCGCSIDVIDARRAKAIMDQGKKTDRIDAQKLAQICRTGWYTKVHRKSSRARELRSFLTARKQLVESANAIASSIQGILKAHGIIVSRRGNYVEQVKLELKGCSPTVRSAVAPLLSSYKQLHDRQKKMYKQLDKIAESNEQTRLLMSVPGVGPATAAAFVSTIDNPDRFSSPEKLCAYLGLVPSVYQSGDTEFRGRITKTGDSLLRWLLVEAASSLMNNTKQDHPIKSWGKRIEKEKGFGKARVAVARKLSCLLLSIWKNGAPYTNPIQS